MDLGLKVILLVQGEPSRSVNADIDSFKHKDF